MKKLDMPEILFEDVFDDCIENIRQPRKQNLENARNVLIANNAVYEGKADTSELYTIASHVNVTADVDKDDMVYLYDGKLLKKEGRDYYDVIVTSAPHDTCPFCGQRKVKSIDHYLPKTLYPSFAITPVNLVPCCSDCNKDKGTADADDECEQLIHPYFDDLGELIWLEAEIVERNPISFVFNILDFSDEDEILYARIVNQFNLLGLDKLYSSHAAEELENIRGALIALKLTDDENVLVSYLEIQFNSCLSRNPNSWNTAMFRALMASAWFRNQDFE